MDINENWSKIKEIVERGQRSTLYCSIASISDDGMPNVTPIGTVFLRDDQTGYYFDHYTSSLAANLDRDPRLCLSAVDAGKLFWFKSLWAGHFTAPPGVRLYGQASALREATREEIELIEARVKPTKWLKGSKLLWTGFTHVRDIKFTSYRPITYPVMMDGLW